METVRIDKDQPITLKLGLAAGAAVAIFLAGQWSESKLRDFEGLRGQVLTLTEEVLKLTKKVDVLNNDLVELLSKKNNANSDDAPAPFLQSARSRPTVQEGGAGKAVSRATR
jgi:hypothetical protein